MDLVLLKSFLAVADAGTISGAANRLGLTQPALSRRIHQLEDYFGVRLLNRGKTGVSLTATGELVVPEARVLVDRYERLRALIAAHAKLEGGSVRIGGGATAVSFLLPPAIAAFQRQHPLVRFEVKEAGSQEIAENVANAQLELGIVTLPPNVREFGRDRGRYLDVRPLAVDHIVPICSRNHLLAGSAGLGVKDLASQTLVGFERGSAIRQIIDDTLRAAGIEMNVVMELRSIPGIIRMVATTQSLGFVSRMGVIDDSRVQLLEVHGLEVRRELAIVTRKGSPLSPAAESFTGLLMGRAQTTAI